MAGACAAAAVNRSEAVAACVVVPPARLFHEARGRERARDHGPDVDPATPRLMLGTAIESRPRPEHGGEIRH